MKCKRRNSSRNHGTLQTKHEKCKKQAKRKKLQSEQQKNGSRKTDSFESNKENVSVTSRNSLTSQQLKLFKTETNEKWYLSLFFFLFACCQCCLFLFFLFSFLLCFFCFGLLSQFLSFRLIECHDYFLPFFSLCCDVSLVVSQKEN